MTVAVNAAAGTSARRGVSWPHPDAWHGFEDARAATQATEPWGVGHLTAAFDAPPPTTNNETRTAESARVVGGGVHTTTTCRFTIS